MLLRVVLPLPVALIVLGLALLAIVPDYKQPDLVLSPAIQNHKLPLHARNFVPFSISNDYEMAVLNGLVQPPPGTGGVVAPSGVSQAIRERFNGNPSDGVLGIAINR